MPNSAPNGNGKGKDGAKLMTMQDVAELFNCHYMTIYRLVQEGELQSIKLGRVYRFSHQQIEAYLRKHTI